jgi:hypothetical protein
MTELELRRATEAFGRAAAAGTVSARELHDFQLGLQWDVFGGPASERREDIDANDPRVQAILDALEALSLIEPGDPSHPWSRANVLQALGRHSEAAKDYLLAAERFDEEDARADGPTGDEADWAADARLHAARSFALAGKPVAAQSLLPRLDAAGRAEVEPLLQG